MDLDSETWTVHASLCLYPYINLYYKIFIVSTISLKDELMVVSSSALWPTAGSIHPGAYNEEFSHLQTKFKTGVNALHVQVSVYCFTNRP